MTILDSIVAKKTASLPEIRRASKDFTDRSRPLYSLKKTLYCNPNLSVIAEIKRGSPSLGLLAPHLDIQSLGQHYQSCGASAISILTDEHFFGDYEDVKVLAPLLNVPVLAKDFILDPVQIIRAYSAGADIILLIAAILTPEQIRTLADTAFKMGMEVILEVHAAEEVSMDSIPSGVILGLNNRNLKTFEVDIANGIHEIERLRSSGTFIVAESGIHTIEQALLLRDAGFSGMLIGESLVRDGVNGSLVRELTAIPKEVKECMG